MVSGCEGYTVCGMLCIAWIHKKLKSYLLHDDVACSFKLVHIYSSKKIS